MRTLAAAVALAAVAVLTPAPASAVPTCVAQGEYQQVETDMRKAKVEAIFDGYLGDYSYYSTLGGNEYDERYYDPCWLGVGRWVVIKYVKLSTSPYWRVQWKAVQ